MKGNQGVCVCVSFYFGSPGRGAAGKLSEGSCFPAWQDRVPKKGDWGEA